MSHEKFTAVHSSNLLRESSAPVTSMVITAFFAAMIFLGIQSFRIPLPAAVGTPFLHFGHIFVMLSVVCLGNKRSSAAAVLGLVIFDLLNGYLHAIPNVFVSAVINCMLAGTLFAALKKNANGNLHKEYTYGVLCAVVYGISNIVVDFIWSTAELLFIGSSLPTAIAAEISSIPATMINAGFTVIGIAVLYMPVTTAYNRILRVRT
ncbi:MAG: ECF transporter S component [Lachnospiraceae bacterium]|nr:ECF transporter S component [Lachnospiraceae bacterium]MDE7179184.1 ECF transporter S component [Lachnospiraceae bacterium]